MMHMPALVMMKQIGGVLQSVTKLTLTVRGFYGEGTQAVGNFYQVSNQLTLGQSEDEVLGCCQMFFLPDGTRMVGTLSGIPTGGGSLRINTGAIMANYTTKARQGCLFGVGALDAQQQAYPVTYPCPSTFGAAQSPTTSPAAAAVAR